MAWAAPTDQGYDFATVGRNRRMPVGFDGLKLVVFAPQEGACFGPVRRGGAAGELHLEAEKLRYIEAQIQRGGRDAFAAASGT